MNVALKEQRIRITDAGEFGRVAVMYGGFSSEREVSIDSGEAVLAALLERGIDAHAWDPADKDLLEFSAAGFDRVWIALHGPGGEDGALQGALQWLKMPYTGSGVMASALAMDKVKSKELFRAGGINTPEYVLAHSSGDANIAVEEFGFPLVIKPTGQGSSVGMSKVFDAGELPAAMEIALSFGGSALVERCVVGDESTVSVLQGQALPSIRIETPRVFYDYRAKYESDNTQYHCPGTTDPELEQQYHDVAVAAYKLLAADDQIEFVGNVEGHQIISGPCDVLVCSGFVGNALLKFYESMAGFVVGILRESGIEQQTEIDRILRFLDYTEYGGAPLLGVAGVAILCHGSSPPRAIKNATRAAIDSVRSGLVPNMRRSLEEMEVSV